jgi:hypothetical protein
VLKLAAYDLSDGPLRAAMDGKMNRFGTGRVMSQMEIAAVRFH